MSLDTRNSSALFKRAEQLKRWEESETNHIQIGPKSSANRKIKFSSGCIFLAACVSGDKDEVLRLIDEGADIDTANVDGLTALHQACIDDNLDMVEFLVKEGADVNRKDNEGWTPLHATASCGFLSIARFLIESGADLAALNSDCEIPIDLASSDQMEDLIQKNIDIQGINCDEVRQVEEIMMLNDAKKWLKTNASEIDRPDPKTGATALHVASAKGYTKVLGLLLAGRADVDKQDNDGWTPLHAATYWGQKEAIQMLVGSLADMDIKNFSGQTAIEIAPKDLVGLLEELKKNSKRTKRRPASQTKISDNNNVESNIETPHKVIRVEVKNESKGNDINNDDKDKLSESEGDEDDEEDDTDTESTSDDSCSSSSSSISESIDDKPNTTTNESQEIEPESPWRRNDSLKIKTQIDSTQKNQVPEKENQSGETEVILRRTQSFESDEKFYQKYKELRARIKANSLPVLPAPLSISGVGSIGGGVNRTANNYVVQRSASLKDQRQLRKTSASATATTTVTPASPATPITSSPPTSPTSTPTSAPSSGQIRSRQSSIDAAAVVTPVPRRTSNASTDIGVAFQQHVQQQVPSKPASLNYNMKIIEAMNERNKLALKKLEDNENKQKLAAAAVAAANNKLLNSQNNTPLSLTTTPPTTTTATQNTTPPTTTTTTTTSTFNKLSPGNIFKNFFKSFVPPTRDEESETQRKAHAKRVRETRRSTQGVTLDEIKSAEQLVKQKNATNSDNDTISTATIINDRVPSTGTTTDEFTTTSSGGDLVIKNKLATEENSENLIASYTISAPSTLTSHNKVKDEVKDADVVSEEHDENGLAKTNNTSTSFTLSKPVTANSDIKRDSVISATLNVSSSVVGNNLSSNKKTDDDDDPDLDSNRISVKSDDSIKLKLSKEQNQQQLSRSLFDLDNASSLTLADKLRHEANKYSEENNVDIGSSNTNSNNKAGVAASIRTASPITTTSITTPPPSPSLVNNSAAERRPSWRLKVDAGSKFKLEDASSTTSNPPSPVINHNSSTTNVTITQKRNNNNNISNSISTSNNHSPNVTSSARPLSTTTSHLTTNSETTTAATTTPSNTINDTKDSNASTEVTLSLRRLKNNEDKENDKENDSRSAQAATQAVIQRRKRPKRRSTGVVHVDMDDLDPERQESPVDGEEKESGSERSRSRVNSINSLSSEVNDHKADTTENGEVIDYKALYEATKAENDRLKLHLRKKDDDLMTSKSALERFTNAVNNDTTKNSLSELEKRERRAMERKISEMEEEVKQMDALKTENQRLKDENGALIRVISKLSK